MLRFPQSAMRIILLLISVSKSVTWYSGKIFVHCILIHRGLFAFQVHALRKTIKLGFSGTLGGCIDCSLVKSGFYCIAP